MNPKTSSPAKRVTGKLLGFLGLKRKPTGPVSRKAPAVREGKESKPSGGLLEQVADGRSLIDGSTRLFIANGTDHTAVFTYRRIVLDGVPYQFRCDGVTFDLLKAARDGDTLDMEVGAFGKRASIRLNEAELAALTDLLSASGSHSFRTTEGLEVVLTQI